MDLKSKKIERILVRSTNWIGDAVMTTPALNSLKHNFPDAWLAVLAKKWVAPVFAHHPAVDAVIELDEEGRRGGLSGLIRLAAEIRSHKFDLAVLFQNAFGAALTVRMAGVLWRLGYDTDGRGFLLNLKIKVRPEDRQIHETRYYQNILERSGLEVVESNPVFYPGREGKAAAEKRLAAEGLADSFLLGVAPGASYGSAKQWPVEKFVQAMEIILGGTGGAALLFGSRAEAAVTSKIKESFSGKVLDTAGRTDLDEAAALIKECGLFLTNDSGLMHVASGVGVPIVALFGSTDPVTTGPVTNRGRVIRHQVECAPCLKRVCDRPDHLCMALVSPEEVAAAGFELIGGGEKRDG